MSWRLGKSFRLRSQSGYLSKSEKINRAWENIKESIKALVQESIILYELMQYKPRFDEECLGLLYQRKQAKMPWLQDPSLKNVDNLNNIRREPSRHFRYKGRNICKLKSINLKLTVRSKYQRLL
jgi:hypothetical protein